MDGTQSSFHAERGEESVCMGGGRDNHCAMNEDWTRASKERL
jgi:hypothetical protein